MPFSLMNFTEKGNTRVCKTKMACGRNTAQLCTETARDFYGARLKLVDIEAISPR